MAHEMVNSGRAIGSTCSASQPHASSRARDPPLPPAPADQTTYLAPSMALAKSCEPGQLEHARSWTWRTCTLPSSSDSTTGFAPRLLICSDCFESRITDSTAKRLATAYVVEVNAKVAG